MIVTNYHGGKPSQALRTHSIDEPCRNVDTQNRYGITNVEFTTDFNEFVPFVLQFDASGNAMPVDNNENSGHFAEHKTIHFIQASNGGEPSSKISSVEDPCRVVTTGDNKALVGVEQIISFISIYHGNGHNCHDTNGPAPVIAANDGTAIVNAEPFIVRDFSKGGDLHSINSPAGSMTANPKLNMVSAEGAGSWILNPSFDNVGSSINSTIHTILAGRKHAYIVNPSYGGNCGDIEKPSPVVVARQDKAPLHLCQIDYGQNDKCYGVIIYKTDSEEVKELKRFMALYGITDIKMRMLKVSELLLIQGFPKDYILKGSQSDQKKFIGNSVEVTQAMKLAECYGPYLQEIEMTCAEQA